MTVFEHLVVGPLDCNCYLVGDPESREAIVIDPGGDAGTIAGAIAKHGLTVTAIVATHAHFDHVVAAQYLKETTGAPFFLHDLDRSLLDWYEESGRMFLGAELGPPPAVDSAPAEGDRLKAGTFDLEVLHTPGHSPGSISLVGATGIFAGDTLFAGSVGRSDLPGGDPVALVQAIRQKLFVFDDNLAVFPGHGPTTTIGQERVHNPFVGQAAQI